MQAVASGLEPTVELYQFSSVRFDRLKLQISSSSTFDLGLSCMKTVPTSWSVFRCHHSWIFLIFQGFCDAESAAKFSCTRRSSSFVCTSFALFLEFSLRAEETIALRKQETKETILLLKQWALRTHSVIHGNWRSDEYISIMWFFQYTERQKLPHVLNMWLVPPYTKITLLI